MPQRFFDSILFGLLSLLLVAVIAGGGVLVWRGVQPRPVVRNVPTPVLADGAADVEPSATAETVAPTPAVRDSAPRPAMAARVPNVRVSAGKFTAHSEVALAQNPRDPRNLVGASKMFTDNQNYIFRTGTYASFDGGKTWIDNGQLPGLDQFTLTSDPTVAFDQRGTAYVEVLAARGPDKRSALYLYTSTDGGKTWSTPALVTDDATGFNDKEWLAVDTTGGAYDGRLYTVWVQIVGEAYRIMFARSTDGGATWSQPRLLAGKEKVTRQGPVVSVDADGNLYVLWSNLTESRFESIASTDGGATWSNVQSGLRFQNVRELKGNLRRTFVLPAFSASPRTPRTLYAAWDDGRSGDGDILFSVSTDGGTSWREPVVINGATTNDQFMPWLAADTEGDVYVQWFDRRDDPQNLLIHTYAARSRDNGKTWSELRVTDVASDPTVGLPLAGKAGFYGDYQALVADTSDIRLFWNETRDGSQEVYSATVADERWDLPYRVPQAGPARNDPRPPVDADADNE